MPKMEHTVLVGEGTVDGKSHVALQVINEAVYLTLDSARLVARQLNEWADNIEADLKREAEEAKPSAKE